MNQINLDKLLKNATQATNRTDTSSVSTVKLLVNEMYSARLQMLSGSEQLQVQTPQGRLSISLPLQLGQQISQQFGQQMQISISPAANNQLSLTLQSPPGLINNIALTQAQLQPLLKQWLSEQLPQLLKPASGEPAANLPQQPNSAVTNALSAGNAAVTKSDSSLVLAVQLALKSGQLQLAGTAPGGAILLTLKNKELANVAKLLQQPVAQPAPNSSARLPLLLRLEFNKGPAAVQLSWQAPGAAQPSAVALSAATQQQLLQALIGQLAPVKQALPAGIDKIALGPLTISLPPQLAAAASASSNVLPLLLQLQAPTAGNSQWQLLIQTAPQSQQLNLPVNQADRPVQLLLPEQAKTAATATTSGSVQNSQLNMLAPETKTQAWRNLLPLLSQPLMQPGNMPSLPAPLQQLLSQVQQSLPDISKPLAPPVLAAQLNALLQFQPLQSQPNLQTTGGTLALAIQLLLGHLSQKQLAPANTTPANRLSQLVSLLDTGQAGAALRQLASLSSPLQQSQLATLDAQSQLQQWLLQLPLQQQGQTILPQLLLEQREADGKNGEAKQKQWQLTMKFDLQQYGNLLAVAKLQQQDLQLQFYTDHNQALQLAEKFLPLLKDRCTAQGLTISKAECQLGKIPDSLLPRHNSLLTVKV